MNKIKETSPDKVHGKLVKYRQGDCLSVGYNDKYLAVIVSRKFNKYYDLTLLDYYGEQKPEINDFLYGKFFGTRFGSWEELIYAVNVRMISCKYIDANITIEKIGDLKLISTLKKDGYAYLDTINELFNHYVEELPVRIEKSRNAEKFPDLAFVSKHLIDMKFIIEH